jgi:putative ABC transport system permease protein
MDSLLQDLRYAVRSLRRTPGFTLTVIAVMALGIGVNSFIFSAVRGILLAKLPFGEPDRIFKIETLDARQPAYPFEMSMPNLRDVIARAHTFRGVGGWTGYSAFVTAGDEPQRYEATMAGPGLLEALGVQPVKGRWFSSEECTEAGYRGAVVLGYRAWQEQFAGDPQVLGRTLHMNGLVRTVVGVMPEGFRFPETSDYFVPLAMDDSSGTRGAYYLEVVGRLAPGATAPQARAELAALGHALARDYPATNENETLVANSFRDNLVKGPRPALIMLMLAVIFVLLIACANVANLQLARAAARRREMGVRIALGASRARLVRQMLTESLLLSLVGGALGVVLGNWGMRLTVASIPETLPYWMHLDVDPLVLAVVLAISVFAGLAFGLAPALQTTSGDVLTPLREGTPGGGDTPASRRMRGMLVVAEVAMSVLLLIGSGLMVRSFLWQTEQRSVLRSHGVLTGTVTLPVALYPDDAQRVAFFNELRARLAGLPGVQAVGAVANLHLGTNQWNISLQRENQDGDNDSQNPHVCFNLVTPGYLSAVGLPLVRGRDFTDGDAANAPRVSLVNQAAARMLWPNQDPIGKRWRYSARDTLGWITVVGVVANVRQHLHARESRLAEILVPHAQAGNQSMTWALRARGDLGALAAAVRRALRARDPNLPFFNVHTLDEHILIAAWDSRLYAQLMTVFSLLALLIAALGLYGVMTYSVAQRTREIGIRIALGAARADVQRMVVGQALRLTLLGIGFGLALAFALTRFMQGILFGVRPDDPPTFVVVTLILALSSAAAAWLPTARAVRVDPVVALRHE